MAMLTVWGRENSSNVKKVLWLLTELKQPYQLIKAGGQYGKNHDAEYLALNPNGLVPCLQDNDFILWESNAILRYLAARYGDKQLWPDNIQQRANGDKWLDWASSTLAPPFKDVMINLVRKAPEERDMAAVNRSMVVFEQQWALLDNVLEKQHWLSGDQFGLGDIPAAIYFYAWNALPIERQAHPHLARWYQQLTQRPAYQQHVMQPLS
jgi:glutathione S-transferase